MTDKTPDVKKLEWGRKTVRRLVRKLGISDRTENRVSPGKGGAGRMWKAVERKKMFYANPKMERS